MLSKNWIWWIADFFRTSRDGFSCKPEELSCSICHWESWEANWQSRCTSSSPPAPHIGLPWHLRASRDKMGHEAVRKCSVSQWKSECKKIRVKDSNKGRKLSTRLNKRVVILPSEWWKNKWQGQSKEQNPPSPFIGSLSVRRVKQMLWGGKKKKKHPILSQCYFEGPSLSIQRLFYRWAGKVWTMRFKVMNESARHLCNKALQVKASCSLTPGEERLRNWIWCYNKYM